MRIIYPPSSISSSTPSFSKALTVLWNFASVQSFYRHGIGSRLVAFRAAINHMKQDSVPYRPDGKRVCLLFVSWKYSLFRFMRLTAVWKVANLIRTFLGMILLLILKKLTSNHVDGKRSNCIRTRCSDGRRARESRWARISKCSKSTTSPKIDYHHHHHHFLKILSTRKKVSPL